MQGIVVEGSDARDVQRRLFTENVSWLSIDVLPRNDWDHDRRCDPSECERFVVKWRSHNGNETFRREVNSVKELNAVLKPIFDAQRKGARESLARELTARRKHHSVQLAAAGIALKQAQKRVDELEERGA